MGEPPAAAQPHIAIVLYKYFAHGGAQRDAVALARALQAHGFRCTIYVSRCESTPPSDVPIVELAVSGVQNHQRARAFERRLGTILATNHRPYVVSFVRSAHADYYVAVDPCFAVRLKSKRPDWLVRLNPRDRYHLAAESAVLSGSHRRYAFLSDSHKREFASAYPLDPERCEVLPIEVNPSFKRSASYESDRRAARNKLGVAEHQLLCISAGSGFRTKGLDRSIDAIAALRTRGIDAQLLVAGDDTTGPFERQAKVAGIEQHVRFLGGRSDLNKLFFAADVLLHPARFEAAGKVLLEGLAAGLPIVTTDVCGYAAQVQLSGGGVVLPSPFDAASFVDAVLTLTDAEQREEVAHKACAFAATLPPNAMAEHLARSVIAGYEQSRKVPC